MHYRKHSRRAGKKKNLSRKSLEKKRWKRKHPEKQTYL
jgi:hypothetical protein